MLYLAYTLAGVCMVCAFVSAIAYANHRRFIAPTAKLLATVCFLLIALICNLKRPQSGSYGIMIFAALVCGLIGDILLMVKEFFADKDSEYFLITGVIFFALGHLIYTARFIMLASSFRYYLLPLLAVVPIGMLIATRMKLLKIGKFAPIMLTYGALLGMTFVSTLNLCIVTGGTLSQLVLSASLFFLISDTALCLNYYGPERIKAPSNYFVMIFYFLAQVLYAFSVLYQ